MSCEELEIVWNNIKAEARTLATRSVAFILKERYKKAVSCN